MMTQHEYDQWLQSREEKARRAVEPASMIGLAGEMKVITLQQQDMNEFATQQIQMIEEEKRRLAEDHSTNDYSEQQSKFLEKLDSIRDEDE